MLDQRVRKNIRSTTEPSSPRLNRSRDTLLLAAELNFNRFTSQLFHLRSFPKHLGGNFCVVRRQ